MARRRLETMLWRAHRAWCWRCMELVGPPRTLIKEAKADLRAHRWSSHRKHSMDTDLTTEPRGDWRNRLSDPPRPRTLPELMLLVLDVAEEDARAVLEEHNGSARNDFEALTGYDLYDQLRDLLTGPLFDRSSSSQQ